MTRRKEVDIPRTPTDEVPKPTRAEVLDNWFTYHPPTDETRPKYAATSEAFKTACTVFQLTKTDEVPSYEAVTNAARRFVEAIDEHCPPSADATAAVRCVRLARNAKNDALLKRGGKVYDPDMDFQALAMTQLTLARYQANSAIACGGR